jgi:Ca2+/Na+ antiporter
MIGKLKFLFIIGIVTLVLPYIGVPDSWKRIITIAFGALIIYLTFALKHEHKILRGRINRLEQPTINNDIQIHE